LPGCPSASNHPTPLPRMLRFLVLLLTSQALSLSIESTTWLPSTTVEPTSTTTPRIPCKNHVCTEDGLFEEGPCENTFCQCFHGLDFLKTCLMDGTFFDNKEKVCNWPWNIDACGSSTPTHWKHSNQGLNSVTEETLTPWSYGNMDP